MFRIKFFSSFCSSENCFDVFERLCEVHTRSDYGEDKYIYFVKDDSYTHAILLNVAMPKLYIPKRRVLGLAYEPNPFLNITPAFISYAEKHIGSYLIGYNSNLPDLFKEHYAFMWHIMRPILTPKRRTLSIMISKKQFAPGHLYRHKLVQAILKTNMDIDIYGSGCTLYTTRDARLKGEFIENEPYQEYEFHICIENFRLPDYTSEKYTNALIWNTIPVYLGALNPLFPEYTISLTGEIDLDLTLLQCILENPSKYRTSMDVDKVHDRLNLLQHIDKWLEPI